MDLKYEIQDTDNSFRLSIGSYNLAEVMYNAERCTTPMTKDDAEKLIKHIKNHFELMYPIETLNEEEYEPSDFYKFLEKMEEDEDGRDLLKLMMLKAMLED